MDELAKSSQADSGLVPQQSAGQCRYCGGALMEGFYFCLVCGTPFKEVDLVLPKAVPRVLTPGELIERKVPQVKTLFWTYFSVLIGGAILGLIAQGMSGDRQFGMGLSFFIQEALLLTVTGVFTVIYWPSLSAQFKRLGMFHQAFWLGLLALAPLLALNYGYHEWLRSMSPQGESGGLIEEMRQLGIGEAGLVVLICIFPAVLEEIAFRGLLQHWLHVAVRPFLAIVLASALFAALHFSVLSFPYLFLVGAVLGWTKYKTGSLYPCMIIHFLHNFIVLEYFAG